MGLDRQRAFDIASLRIMEQRRPSQDITGRCRYRTFLPDGELRCTIGWLIPDYRYSPHLEDNMGGSLDHVARTALTPELGGPACPVDIAVLTDMRFAHDAAAGALRYGDCHVFLAEFIRRMRTVAGRYDLDPCCLERRRIESSGSPHGQYVLDGIL